MGFLIHIAAGGPAALLWILFVLITVVAQLIKAARRGGGQAPRTGPPRGPASNPEDELRDFLQGLSRPEQEAPPAEFEPPPPLRRAPPPPPPPPPVPSPRPSPRTAPAISMASEAAREPRVPVSPPLVTTSPSPPPPELSLRTPIAVVHDPYALASARVSRLTVLRKETYEDVRNRTGLARGILLREILGPPVALRKRHPDLLF